MVGIKNDNQHKILINVLTRTSNRPIGFLNCHQSVINQTYNNVLHWVSYEDEATKKYIEGHNVHKVKVDAYNGTPVQHSNGFKHAPYNLYCNKLLNQITKGWVLFLDDDDHLIHHKVLEEIVSKIEQGNEDTLFIWQMRYPNGKILPLKKHFQKKRIERNQISTPCFLFHSKYKNQVVWDEWKGSDFRVVSNLFKIIPNKKWIEKVYVQINNFGDYGNRNDISLKTSSKIIFKKNAFWSFIPKYHTKINGVFVFHKKTYIEWSKRLMNKIKRYVKNNR
ncbi:glycosyltransferase family protein [Aestuariibaculum sediminum]|uniref:Uncharacterized protein n=1 Tax=Aestuariibaculum sediminum TaxID=2770637 RepID=A0A8J6Q8W4_9FLAO|nr:hypothetical protein [Aestuariibaculum sediminum]MBD0833090.1 hypothetical protein [Aestuariibaculum sediminum]